MRQLSLKPLICHEVKDKLPLQSNVLLIRIGQPKKVVSIILFNALAGETQCFIPQIMFISGRLACLLQVLDL